MLIHGSCAAWQGEGVLLVGPSGSGKSDLLLRLLADGFALVADDQVLIEDGDACAPPELAGLIEARGLGIVCLPYIPRIRPVLVASLSPTGGLRLPEPERYHALDLPLLHFDAFAASTPAKLKLALDCLAGRATLKVGALFV